MLDREGNEGAEVSASDHTEDVDEVRSKSPVEMRTSALDQMKKASTATEEDTVGCLPVTEKAVTSGDAKECHPIRQVIEDSSFPNEVTEDPGDVPQNIYNRGVITNFRNILFPPSEGPLLMLMSRMHAATSCSGSDVNISNTNTHSSVSTPQIASGIPAIRKHEDSTDSGTRRRRRKKENEK
jgi:hypothetical protein